MVNPSESDVVSGRHDEHADNKMAGRSSRRRGHSANPVGHASTAVAP